MSHETQDCLSFNRSPYQHLYQRVLSENVRKTVQQEHSYLAPDIDTRRITNGRLWYKAHECNEILGRTRRHSCDVIREPVLISVAEIEFYPSSFPG